MGKEIERKWLLKDWPKDAENVKAKNLFVVYPSVILDKHGFIIQEVRIRRDNGSSSILNLEANSCKKWPDKITIKSGGSVSREEIEAKLLDGSLFDKFVKESGVSPIHKEYKYWRMEDDHKFEVSKVDNGFIYAEVEFKDEMEAREYEFPYPEVLVKEITTDMKYRMANYWLECHLDNSTTIYTAL